MCIAIFTQVEIGNGVDAIGEAHKARGEGAREAKIEMAKIMKMGGADIKLISIASGLTVEEVEKLK